MGLKAFHLIFIAASIALAGYFSYWSFFQSRETSSISYSGISLFSIMITISLIIYGIKTQKKFRS